MITRVHTVIRRSSDYGPLSKTVQESDYIRALILVDDLFCSIMPATNSRRICF